MQSVVTQLAHFILPPRCPTCREPLSADGYFCATCWLACDFLSGPLCVSCGQPFESDLLADEVCGACLTHAPAFDWCRSAFRYDGPPRKAILSLKHGRDFSAAPPLARAMAPLVQAVRDVVGGAPLVVPVPLHPRRVRQRRFNQSLVLAQALAKTHGLDIDTHSLRRKRYTAPQAGKGRKARARNVKGVFSVTASKALEGRACLLVDDVYTTGATADAAAKALKRAGSAWVGVVTAARVV